MNLVNRLVSMNAGLTRQTSHTVHVSQIQFSNCFTRKLPVLNYTFQLPSFHWSVDPSRSLTVAVMV